MDNFVVDSISCVPKNKVKYLLFGDKDSKGIKYLEDLEEREVEVEAYLNKILSQPFVMKQNGQEQLKKLETIGDLDFPNKEYMALLSLYVNGLHYAVSHVADLFSNKISSFYDVNSKIQVIFKEPKGFLFDKLMVETGTIVKRFTMNKSEK